MRSYGTKLLSINSVPLILPDALNHVNFGSRATEERNNLCPQEVGTNSHSEIDFHHILPGICLYFKNVLRLFSAGRSPG